MSDSKTKPNNPTYMLTDEQHQAAHARTMRHEEESKAIYRIEAAGATRREAQDIVWAGCDTEDAIEMIEQGKTKDEIINALKKNDEGEHFTL
ncbi:MAG: hypothetical protein AB2805_07435 [Candidatus Thiodiazotropha sp.]